MLRSPALDVPVLVLAAGGIAYAFGDGAWRFHSALSGRRAPLALGLPRPGWQQVLARFAASWVLIGVALAHGAALNLLTNGPVLDLPAFQPGDKPGDVPPPPPDPRIDDAISLLYTVSAGAAVFAGIALFHALKHRTPAAPVAGLAVPLLYSFVLESQTIAQNVIHPTRTGVLPIVLAAAALGVGLALASWLLDRRVET